jgi:predicted Zn finger-like uncharacterized protein
MTQSYITQCPQCRTSFRVNHAQLGAAHGAVRCGACLHVFNAVQQLRESGVLAAPPAPQPSTRPAPPSAPAPAPAPAKPETPSQKTDDTLWIHDDLDLDNLDLDEELAKLEAQEQAFSRQFLAAEAAPSPKERFLQAREPEHEVDESWTQALLRDTPSTAPAAEPTPQQRPVPKPPVSPAPSAAPSTPIKPATPHDPVAPPPKKEIEISARRDTLNAGTPSIRARNDEPRLDEPLSDEPSPAPTKPQRNEPGLRSDSLFELDEEPLQLDWRPQQRKPWGRWLGWGLLNLLAASALAGQYVSYNFAELARQDDYRPWFEQLCPLIDCKLPSKVDVSQVKSSNLVVRSHPQFAGALVVDAIIYNRAAFTQPFPLLEMRFADINGQLLASRRFKPGEYLAGELAGQAQMPPQTPIHISMDILDPGTQAVNYSIHFHSPE